MLTPRCLTTQYKSSTFVGFKHPVTARHAWFSSGSRLLAWAELAQTGAAYSAVEYLSAKAVVRIVLGFAPHFEVTSFVSWLLRVATFVAERPI